MKMRAYLVQVIGLLVGSLLSPIMLSSIASENRFNTHRVGLQFEDSQVLNEGKLVTLTGTTTTSIAKGMGHCVGNLYISPTYESITSRYETPGTAKVRFVSGMRLPDAGLRVVVRNVTAGIDPTLSPYTDREYNQGDRSESFVVKQDTSHSSRYVAVIPGLNRFTYQIKRNNDVIEAGGFTANITLETKADEQSQDSRASNNDSLDAGSNRCDKPSLPDIGASDFQIPDFQIPDFQMPDIPPVSP